eukprot:CAMPEP_0176448964 /NCGR_PEP_ID=MMETSP0127-20121128/26150_1 /TAXON_ID=938130 /ORGANISM="Platyophrya macrostoma, Strain WH" /LENGTH=1072 /DNA_ID=CAMNT_0017836121 /DNA_START=163 /DNA_END=3381 /DNA_ORIENTATION=-
MSAEQSLKDFPEQLNFAKMEEEVLAYWKDIKAFETSLKKSEGKKPYNFYDGPPFATGLPHYGHILAGTIKDIVCRYAHQTGHHVERRFGWDCHGLPIEFEIEKQLGIKSSHDVKKFGIENYNAECRKIVMRYAHEWEVIIGRTGRWIDFQNDYKTMNMSYMESVWWVFKQLWEKDLVYRGFKVMPFSTSCTTPLSNFEANMNYKDVSDPSAMVSFPLEEDNNTHLIAWTTTPWTLPSNLALCVNPDMDYIKVLDAKTSRHYIFAECRLDEVYKNHAKEKTPPFTVVAKFKGAELAGKKYVPLFPYFLEKEPNAFRVICDKFVTSDSGTGVVHCAPGFGEEDFRASLANKIFAKGTIVCPVDENGHFTADVAEFKGRYIKDCDAEILKSIQANGRLINKAAIVHSYPFCWRSDTPLIYKAVDSWFVRVENIRDQLLAANADTTWVPDFVKTKRFSNWLEDAKDWNVSRNRYWGTPLPVWHSADWEEIVCVGSVAELEELSGVTGITDIHREFVDRITIPSKRPGMPPLRRIEEVFDCWFESGSMPYAQCHYPFENKEEFEKRFPADFIAEGLDQTRGWFYTMLVLSTALFGTSSYKNLVCNGLVLAEDGKKMSKRLKNYPEPTLIVDQYGADALRLYLINSPVVRAEPLRFREAGVKDIVKDVFLPLVNAAKFFISNGNRYLSAGGVISVDTTSRNEMDRWILASTQTLVQYVHKEMNAYHLYTVVPGVLRFVEELTNWYVRMNRRRLKGSDGDNEDWGSALSTLLNVFFTVCRVLAPFTPFMAENLYQRVRSILPEEVRGEESVHYLMLPEIDASKFDDALEQSMGRMMKIVDLVRVLRDRIGIPMKMPVRQVIVVHPNKAYLDDVSNMAKYIREEVNAFDVTFSEEGEYVVTKLDANLGVLGKRLKKEAMEIRKVLVAMPPEQVREFIQNKGGVVCGHQLTMDDVKILRTFREGIQDFESNTDNDVVVLVDKRSDETLVNAWRAREFVNRVQQLRKKAKLVITDQVSVFFSSADESLVQSILACAEQVSQTVKGVWTTADKMPSDAEKIAEEDNEISEIPIKITLTKPVSL